MNNPISRDSFWDLTKGVLIYLVVLGHTIQYIIYGGGIYSFEDPIFKYIYSFHMPAFIFISGFFSSFYKINKISIKELFKSRFRIIIPMTFWVILALLLKIIFDVRYGQFNYEQWAYFFLDRFFNSYWFIWSIIISCVICKLTSYSQNKKYISLLAFSILFIVIPLRSIPIVGVTLYLFSFVFPFFCLGVSASNDFTRKFFKTRTILFYSTSGLVFFIIHIFILSIYSNETFIYANKMNLLVYYREIIIMMSGALIGLFSFLIAMTLIYKIFRTSKAIEIISLIGQQTLPIYLFQILIFAVLSKFHISIYGEYSYTFRIFICALISVAFIIFISFSLKITNRIPSLAYFCIWGTSRSANSVRV
jgi:fucose 4-O-acetylase-like acetyltransferase